MESKRYKFKAVLLVAPAIFLLLTCNQIKPTSAIFNCFTPNMFKMNKGGQPTLYAPPHSGERAGWYPQAQQQYSGYPGYMSMGYHPMK